MSVRLNELERRTEKIQKVAGGMRKMSERRKKLEDCIQKVQDCEKSEGTRGTMSRRQKVIETSDRGSTPGRKPPGELQSEGSGRTNGQPRHKNSLRRSRTFLLVGLHKLEGRAIAQAVSNGFPLRRPEFESRSVHVGFVKKGHNLDVEGTM
jgi:hypothetical protein